ncbi:hypothetical protein MYX64_11275, partial [Nitrospinae bacterium AH_259_B05_G02_I21]|nr:hypothetical protein [Nitrospinae bacterium AH_259_B05_G02_I21]
SRGVPSGELSFTYAGPEGSQIVKRFIFHDDKYAFTLDLYVKRPDGSTMPLDHRVLWAYGLGGGGATYGTTRPPAT